MNEVGYEYVNIEAPMEPGYWWFCGRMGRYLCVFRINWYTPPGGPPELHIITGPGLHRETKGMDGFWTGPIPVPPKPTG